MTSSEGAFWLGVPNLLFIRARDIPSLPSAEPRGGARASNNTPCPLRRWTAWYGPSSVRAVRAV
jgi:hypothetical protein